MLSDAQPPPPLDLEGGASSSSSSARLSLVVDLHAEVDATSQDHGQHVQHHFVHGAPFQMTMNADAEAVPAGLAASVDVVNSYSLKRPLDEVTNVLFQEEQDHDDMTISQQLDNNNNKRPKRETAPDGDLLFDPHNNNNNNHVTVTSSSAPVAAAAAAAAARKVNNEQWDLMVARLIDYKAHTGDCLVPKRYLQDPKLGTWVETQRVQYKRLPQTVI
jgi:hypothetical protein